MFTAAANYNKESLRKTGEKTANKVSEAFQTELYLCSVVTEGSTRICWWCLHMQGARHDGTEA